MPNWCENTLIVKGDSQELIKFIEDTIVDDKFTLNRLYPTPPELLEQTSPNVYRGDDEESKRLHEEHLKNIKDKYGHEDWYHWRIFNWGTKWDTADSYIVDRNDEYLMVQFNTAWSPPYHWLKKIAPDFPKLTFELQYHEEGMGFCGRSMWSIDDGFSDEEGDLCYMDEHDKEVEWDHDKDRWTYVDTKEVIDDEDFIPLPFNKFI